MASMPAVYLAVLKAAYDYEATSEDEISVKEDQLLYLLEKTDDDWWKVKSKDAGDEDTGGLVPAAYVEQAPHKSTVKALYDYDATEPGELTIKEDEVLLAFDAEDGWLLVQTETDGGRAGLVPENYVEETGESSGTAATDEQEEEEEEEEEGVVASAAPVFPAIVVPDSPPRPSAPYVDPAERVAQTHAKTITDHIQTWAVSELDKKGKKKKGTLGIGNGSIFFASESDKTPVQKWSMADVDASYTGEKDKHVVVEILGDNPVNLTFNAGSKSTAEAIIEKLDKSKAATKAAMAASTETSSSPAPDPPDSRGASPSPLPGGSPRPKKNGVSVHFATTPPSIISPREQDEGSEADDYISARDERSKSADGKEWAIALYDFTADGEDELSVAEGDRLTVLERDSDDWWKVRDSLGHEGVVPAQYVELEAGGSANGGDASAREAAEREEVERKRAEKEQKAKLAAEAAEAERKRKERERREEEAEARLREEEEKRRAERTRAKSESRRSEERASASKSRPSSEKPRNEPNPARVRTWHDRTGQFKVDAEFLGFSNGKLRLHKTNGVVIEVPAEKMSHEDIKYIDRLREKDSGPSRALSPGNSDDEPLAVRRRSLQPESKPKTQPTPPKKGRQIDWFEFFLNAGCDIDDCTRYANAFERDKIDEAVLPDITQQTMRLLGLREGDIIRVSKAIAAKSPHQKSAAMEEQLRKDEEYARKLQEEESGGRSTPRMQSTSPGLFAGPGGTLKNNTRRGRPQPSKTAPPANVDLGSISTSAAQIQRTESPSIARVSSPASVTASAPKPAPVSGFDDDAWTNRPSSTQPLAPTPPATQPARAASVPPAQPASQPQTIATNPPPAPTPPAVAVSPTKGLAQTTESDVFEQLARLSALKTQSPATQSPGPASAPPVATPPTVVSPPPGYQNGMGMGPSPVPMGQIQVQPTGVQNGAPRGPFAPVPQNQGLLQPLVPTQTGFGGFVPTRPSSNPPPPSQPSFLNTQPTGFQPQFQSQPTGFPTGPSPQPQSAYPGVMASQPTGFNPGMGGGIAPQPTGLPTTGPIMSQTTSYPGAFGAGPFAGGRAFGPSIQPNPTGFNPGSGFGQVASPPPVPPLPQQNNANNTNPANVFAQMKSGTFGNDNAPQPSNKYDSLRPQPTGWAGMPGQQQGYQGYSGSFY